MMTLTLTLTLTLTRTKPNKSTTRCCFIFARNQMKRFKSNGMTNFNVIDTPERIDLLESERTEFNKKTSLTIPARCCVLGSSQTGKTTAFISYILQYFDELKLNEIILCCPTATAKSKIYADLAKNFGDEFVHFDFDSLPTVNDWPNDGRNRIILFDDFISDMQTNRDLRTKIGQYLTLGSKVRGLKMQSYLVQKYKSAFPLTLRQQFNCWFVMANGCNFVDFAEICDQSVPDLDKSAHVDLYKKLNSEMYSCMKFSRGFDYVDGKIQLIRNGLISNIVPNAVADDARERAYADTHADDDVDVRERNVDARERAYANADSNTRNDSGRNPPIADVKSTNPELIEYLDRSATLKNVDMRMIRKLNVHPLIKNCTKTAFGKLIRMSNWRKTRESTMFDLIQHVESFVVDQISNNKTEFRTRLESLI